MTDLTQIPVPNEGPIADKVKEIYERSFLPEEQVPFPSCWRAPSWTRCLPRVG